MKLKMNIYGIVILSFMLAVFIGCAGDNPIKTSQTDNLTSSAPMLTSTDGGILIDTDCVCDVAFRDTIESIDYQSGTLTTYGFEETIYTDENSVIWIQTFHHHGGPGDDYDTDTETTGSAKVAPTVFTAAFDSLLSFTDLKVGDVIEVRANYNDDNNLVAVMIKLVYCGTNECSQLAGTIESIDYTCRVVAFEELSFIGKVGRYAELLDADGNTITLDDFNIGDPVTIKGYETDTDSLRIHYMALQ